MSLFTVGLLCFHMVVTISFTMPRLLLATSQLQNKVRELKSKGSCVRQHVLPCNQDGLREVTSGNSAVFCLVLTISVSF